MNQTCLLCHFWVFSVPIKRNSLQYVRCSKAIPTERQVLCEGLTMPVPCPYRHSPTCNLGWGQTNPRVSLDGQYLSVSNICYSISQCWIQGIRDISGFTESVSRSESTCLCYGDCEVSGVCFCSWSPRIWERKVILTCCSWLTKISCTSRGLAIPDQPIPYDYRWRFKSEVFCLFPSFYLGFANWCSW